LNGFENDGGRQANARQRETPGGAARQPTFAGAEWRLAVADATRGPISALA
jgi:hypothetical protein